VRHQSNDEEKPRWWCSPNRVIVATGSVLWLQGLDRRTHQREGRRSGSFCEPSGHARGVGGG
jgi:hypothetical protein